MRPVTLCRSILLSLAFASLALSSCSSNTSKKIKSFADKVCACQDAACASAVQAEYLAWWKDNQRARGSEGDRKDIEKSMQRYAECHVRLLGEPEARPKPVVPKVDLRVPVTAPGAAPQAPASAAPDESASGSLAPTELRAPTEKVAPKGGLGPAAEESPTLPSATRAKGTPPTP